MKVPDKVAGLDWREAQSLLTALLNQKQEICWNGDVPSLKVRRVTKEFIEDNLRVPPAEASLIQSRLVEEGWIEPSKLTPTRKGMGLLNHIERPKLSRAAAEAILEHIVGWAERINATVGARVTVKSMFLFGSLERGEAEVSDIDLFVTFSTMDLGTDLEPEDLSREDELVEELREISKYISPASELDQRMMDDVPSRQVFPRIPPFSRARSGSK